MSEPTLADWQVRARAKKQSQIDSIPAEWKIPASSLSNVTRVPYECGLLSSLELEITDTLDVGTILKNLREGIWSSVQVTGAFYKRAVVVHQLVNCLTEIFIERAMARAEEMDRYLKETGKPKGPLHGLPISLKDQFTIKGLETLNGDIKLGYVSNIGDFATENSVLVEILNKLGAVPFVRTNVPQTLMWPETYNHIFGRTLNPYNLDRTPGGSSGGEGALIAMHGSPLGVGTDIGGSIRIPSAMCGIYGLRPSYSRLPYHGARNSMEGQETITSVLGPMSNSISGLKVFTKSVLEARPWARDPMVLRKPWDEEAYGLVEHGGRGGRKCFAVLYDNGLVKPHPPIWRAMEMVRKALEDAGHQVIEWENCRHEDIFVNVNKKLFNADGGEDFDRECAKSGEPVIQTMDPKLYSHELHQPGSNVQEETTETLSVYELWQLQKTKRELRKEYLDQWQSTVSRTETGRPVDAIISPAAQFAAPPHGKYSSTFYTSLWNGMDYPAGVIPVTFVDAEVDKAVPPHEFYSDDDRENYHMYEPEAFHGLPVGLQVVGQRLEEEAVLGKSTHLTSTNITPQTAMMEEVDEALKQYKTNHSLV